MQIKFSVKFDDLFKNSWEEDNVEGLEKEGWFLFFFGLLSNSVFLFHGSRINLIHYVTVAFIHFFLQNCWMNVVILIYS